MRRRRDKRSVEWVDRKREKGIDNKCIPVLNKPVNFDKIIYARSR